MKKSGHCKQQAVYLLAYKLDNWTVGQLDN